MLIKEAKAMLNNAISDSQPSKANPLFTRKQAVKALKQGLNKLKSSRGNIDIDNYCQGVLAIRLKQILEDK